MEFVVCYKVYMSNAWSSEVGSSRCGWTSRHVIGARRLYDAIAVCMPIKTGPWVDWFKLRCYYWHNVVIDLFAYINTNTIIYIHIYANEYTRAHSPTKYMMFIHIMVNIYIYIYVCAYACARTHTCTDLDLNTDTRIHTRLHTQSMTCECVDKHT